MSKSDTAQNDRADFGFAANPANICVFDPADLFVFCHGIKLYGIAIILYAIVPVIRLTDLGIRLVDKDVVEAANAFGMNDGKN